MGIDLLFVLVEYAGEDKPDGVDPDSSEKRESVELVVRTERELGRLPKRLHREVLHAKYSCWC